MHHPLAKAPSKKEIGNMLTISIKITDKEEALGDHGPTSMKYAIVWMEIRKAPGEEPSKMYAFRTRQILQKT